MKYLNLLLLSAIVSAPVMADTTNGEALHQGNCVRCHDSAVYTRENKRVQSLDKLGTQVRFCKDNLRISWFDDEVDDVVEYLNKSYYHF